MNTHLDDGILRAALDGELDAAQKAHLAACTHCQERQQALNRLAQQVSQQLSFLVPSQQDAAPAPQRALAAFRSQYFHKKEPSIMKKLFNSPLLRAAVVAVVALAIILSVPATRAWAGEFLGLFRVQQVTTLPVDLTNLMKLQDNSAFGKKVTDLIASSINFTQKPGQMVEVNSAAEATQAAGFPVRISDQAGKPSSIFVQNGFAFSFLIDRSKAQALLDEAGRKDLVLPQAIDGDTISVTVPAHAAVAYGACPDAAALSGTKDISMFDASGCIQLVQLPSPTVQTPPNLDFSQLAQIALQVTGMSAQQAKDFSAQVDWTTSLVIPIPKNAAINKTITVDGVTGQLVQRNVPDDVPQYVIIWTKNGILYAIGGAGMDVDKALAIANSLK